MCSSKPGAHCESVKQQSNASQWGAGAQECQFNESKCEARKSLYWSFILVPVESKYQTVLFLGARRTPVARETGCNCTVLGVTLVSGRLCLF